MNRRIPRFNGIAAAVAATLVLAVAGVAIAAPPTASTDAAHHGSRLKLDLNQNGSIDRTEAAGHPRLAAGFDRLDKNRDGKLDAAERPRGHGKRGHCGDHDGLAHAIKLDTDGDGRVSTVEAAQSKLATRFATADRNRDGYLVRSELQAAAEQRRNEFAAKRQQRFEATFIAADGNRDGKLSRAEVETHMPRQAKAFAFLDEDRDGFLTRADLRPAPRH